MIGNRWLCIGLAALVIWLASAISPRALAGTGPAHPSDRADGRLAARSKALAAATRVREQSLMAVRADVTVQRFLGNRHHNRIAADTLQKRAESGQLIDRDMMLARFSTDEHRWRVETQMMLWSGSFGVWFPYSRQEADRPADHVSDLYFNSFSDGEVAHQVRGGRDGNPRYSRALATGQYLQAVKRNVRTWLGLGLAFTEPFDDKASKLEDITEENLDGERMYVVRTIYPAQMGAAPTAVMEGRFWIAPEKGYALVRHEALTLSLTRVGSGNRDVYVWSGLTQVNGTWVPEQLAHTSYAYRTDITASGESLDRWVMTQRVRLANVMVGVPVSFDLMEYPIPLGAHAVPPTAGDQPAGGLNWMNSLNDQLEAPRRELRRFLSETPPKPDPAFLRPLTQQDADRLKNCLGN